MEACMQDTSTFEIMEGTDHDLMWGVHMWFG